MASLDPEASVLYVGTLAKVMSADIRMGYVIVPEPLLSIFERAQRHLGLFVPAAMQVALAEFIASGAFLTHIRRMTRLYRIRRDRLVAELAMHAGTRLTVEVPAGGMQLVARLDRGTDDAAICRSLSSRGVVTRPLSEMLYHPGMERGLFLGFSAWTEDEIARGAAVVGDALRSP